MLEDDDIKKIIRYAIIFCGVACLAIYYCFISIKHDVRRVEIKDGDANSPDRDGATESSTNTRSASSPPTANVQDASSPDSRWVKKVGEDSQKGKEPESEQPTMGIV